MNRTLRRLLLLLVIAGSVLVLDQVTKRLIVDNLVLHESRSIIPFLSPVFQITRSHNTGASFGILPNAGDIFAVIAIVVVIVMIYMFPRIPDDKRLMWLATGLICGGALGNVIDRLAYGYVVDFIHYQIPGVVSNVSNIADHAVVGGVILFFIASWRDEREKAVTSPTSTDSPEPPPTVD
ncbi:MAG: signal peptidase II [Chloroflexi bacterium]|nr:signal peptidase II [Chloroflexota bacterium]MCC6895119.1 signal peptidase II [Anaerolineae bacterium]